MIYDFENKSLKREGKNWIAPNASIIGDIVIKNDASIWFNAVLRGDIERIIVGESSNIQDASVLHTDPGCPLTIGNGVTIGHMSMLHGCTIGNNTLIGIGSIILNKSKIGNNCIIGANTLVTENKTIPDNSLVVGSPFKIVRPVTKKEIEHIKNNSIEYVKGWKKYKI